ncbi:MAG: hypothetical protein AAFR93_13760, partial [Pseudomonadota bacterium]
MDRATLVEEKLRARLIAGELPPGRAPRGPLRAEQAVKLFRAQCVSRALDLTSRAMQRAQFFF